jgi:hypothetical protein
MPFHAELEHNIPPVRPQTRRSKLQSRWSSKQVAKPLEFPAVSALVAAVPTGTGRGGSNPHFNRARRRIESTNILCRRREGMEQPPRQPRQKTD